MSKWKQPLEPKDIAALAGACVDNTLQADQAIFALKQINVKPGEIPGLLKAGDELTYYTYIIEYLHSRANYPLANWLLALAQNRTNPEEWSGFQFAKDWLDKLSIEGDAEQRSEAAYMREIFVRPREDLLKPIQWLVRGYNVSRSVAKLKFTDGSVGSGFLVTEDIFFTNAHVVCDYDLDDPERRTFESVSFDYYEDVEGNTNPKNVNATLLFHHLSDDKEIDFAVVKIDSPMHDREIPKINHKKKPKPKQPIYIPQHPRGRRLQIAINNNNIDQVTMQLIRHTAATEKGSSGSPILDDEWEVIGIHCGHKGGLNRGTRISKVLKIINEKASDLYQQLENRLL